MLSSRKQKVSVIQNLLHERHLWRAMYCKSMVISNKGVLLLLLTRAQRRAIVPSKCGCVAG